MRSGTAAIRVLIADDNPQSLQALKLVVEEIPNLQICGEARDGEELVALCSQTNPNIVITDIRMPGMDGMDATEIIKDVHPEVKVLAFTQHLDDQQLLNTIKAGADGYLFKGEDQSTIEDAVHQLLQGESYFSHTTKERIRLLIKGDRLRTNTKPLPPNFFATHEREMLVLLTQELKNEEIAAILGLTRQTVDTYRRNLMAKIRCRNVVGLVTFALEYGIVKEADLKNRNKDNPR